MEPLSVLTELPLFVREDEQPDLYKLTEDDGVELGPFEASAFCRR